MHQILCRTAGLILLTAFLGTTSTSAAEKAEVENSQPVRAFLSQDTVLVGWVDLSQLKREFPDSLRSFHIPQLWTDELERTRDSLLQLGVQRVYWVGGTSDLIRGSLVCLVPVPESKTEPVRLALELSFPDRVAKVAGPTTVAIGNPSDLEQLLSRKTKVADSEFLQHIDSLTLPHALALRITPEMLAPFRSVLPELLKNRTQDPQKVIELFGHWQGISLASDFPPTQGELRFLTYSPSTAGAAAEMVNALVQQEIADAASPLMMRHRGNAAILAFDNADKASAVIASVELLLKPAQQRAARDRTMN
ncbi:MAG: hypothetical protein KDA85_07895 [Planctomycetaceae bacterium]|nr:hypothetical protein [Planctomycetaceae bacterium]